MKVGAFLQCEMNSISNPCSQVPSALLWEPHRKQYHVVTLDTDRGGYKIHYHLSEIKQAIWSIKIKSIRHLTVLISFLSVRKCSLCCFVLWGGMFHLLNFCCWGCCPLKKKQLKMDCSWNMNIPMVWLYLLMDTTGI